MWNLDLGGKRRSWEVIVVFRLEMVVFWSIVKSILNVLVTFLGE